jgi:hypothetical protein
LARPTPRGRRADRNPDQLIEIQTNRIVTLFKPRNGTFNGLLLDGKMKGRDRSLLWDHDRQSGERRSSGDVIEWIKLDGHVTELFDVTAMPGVRCPMVLGPATIEIRNAISFDPIAPSSAA